MSSDPQCRLRGPLRTSEAYAKDLIALTSFVLGHDSNHFSGGVSTARAYLAMCSMMGLDPLEVRKIVRPPEWNPDGPPIEPSAGIGEL